MSEHRVRFPQASNQALITAARSKTVFLSLNATPEKIAFKAAGGIVTASVFAMAFMLFGGVTATYASDLRQTAIVKAVCQAAPSVVNIRGEKSVSPSGGTVEGGAGRRVNGMGTGVILDPRGYIITNHHVVDGVSEIQVTLADGERHVARLIARDPETDLAVIKIDCPEKLRVITLGSSSDLMTGEPVIAVGNAFGYEHTVTRGIISSLHRAVQVSDAQYYSDLIQTDASINPGNSGGALLNIDGEMIGVVVAVRAGAQGIGFAIPINKAIEVAGDLLSARNQSKMWHGLKISRAESKARSANKIVAVSSRANDPETIANDKNGVFVTSVEQKSPAAEAGFKPGDLVTKINDREIRRGLDFQCALLEKRAGDRLAVSLERDGKPVEIELKLASAETAGDNDDMGWKVLGLRLERIDQDRFRKEHKTSYRGGLRITAVRPNSPAASHDIHKGDVLVGMHIWETVSMDNVTYILKRSDINKSGSIKFFILRGNDTRFGYMTLAMRDTRSR